MPLKSTPPAPTIDPGDSAVSLNPAGAVRLIVLLIVITTLLRIALAGMTGLGIDESYMAGISRFFALSYLDHPPLHVWLVGLWAHLTGSDEPVILRLPFIALFAGTTWMMFRLTTAAFGIRAGLWAALLLNLAPVFALSTGSWILPDGPMMFFVLAAASVIYRVIFVDPSRTAALAGWLAAGLLGGLALLSKYLAAFLFIGVLLFLVTSRVHRRWLATPGPWLGALVAVVMMMPVVIWNMTHGWASFVFQGSRGRPAGLNLNWILQDIGGQFGYLTPWIFLPLVYALLRAIARGPGQPASWLFVCLALPPIVIFSVWGLWTPILPHWPMIGWLFVFPLLGLEWANLARRHGPRLRKWTAVAAVAMAGAALLLASHARSGWINRVVPQIFAQQDPTLDLFDWRVLRPLLSQRGLVPEGTVIAATHWIDAGRINFALGGAFTVLCLCAEPHHFPYIVDTQKIIGRDILLIGTARFSRPAFSDLKGMFDRIDTLPSVTLMRDDHPAFMVQLAIGRHLTANSPP